MSEIAQSKLSGLAARRGLEDQINFVLSHPGMSAWLKSALSEALSRDPVDVLNDLEILNLILRQRSEQIIAETYNSRELR